MKRKIVAVLLCSMLVSGLVLTGCDENGFPTEEDFNEVSAGLEEFSQTMEEVSANVEEMSDSIESIDVDSFETQLGDVQIEIDDTLKNDVISTVDGIAGASVDAAALSEDAQEALDVINEVGPDVEKLVTDVQGGTDDMNVLADDIMNIYSHDQIKDLVSQLEQMIQ